MTSAAFTQTTTSITGTIKESSEAAQGFVDVFSDQTIVGKKTFTGTTVFRALSATSLSGGSFNNNCYSDGVNYLTITAAYENCLSSTGGSVTTPINYVETISGTAQYPIGSATEKKPLFLKLSQGSTLNVSSTGGNCLFPIGNGSGITGDAAIGAYGPRISLARTTNLSNVFCPAANNGTQEYFFLRNLFVTGNSPTISSAVIGLTAGAYANSTVQDVIVAGNFPNTALLNVSNATGESSGPIAFINDWFNCTAFAENNYAGCTPVTITSASGRAGFNGSNNFAFGAIEHPSSGLPSMSIDGSGNSGPCHVGATNLFGEYMEQEFSGNPFVNVKDACDTNVFGYSTGGVTPSALFHLTQTAAGKLRGVHLIGLLDTASSTNAVANAVSGHSFPSHNLPFPLYFFGADTSITPNPVVFDMQPLQLYSHDSTTAPMTVFGPCVAPACALTGQPGGPDSPFVLGAWGTQTYALPNHWINFAQIGTNSTAKQYLFLNGTLGSTSTTATPTCTSSLAQCNGIEAVDGRMNVVFAPNGTNQAITRPLRVSSTGLPSALGMQIFNTTLTCTTAASTGATCTTSAISLPVQESDTSYRVVCTGKGPRNVPTIVATTNFSSSQFTITIAAITASPASYSSFDCVAGHN